MSGQFVFFDFMTLVVILLVFVVLVCFLGLKLFKKRKFRLKTVISNGKKEHFLSLDSGRSWYQFYWDETGLAHILLESDQEAGAILIKHLEKKSRRLARTRDDL